MRKNGKRLISWIMVLILIMMSVATVGCSQKTETKSEAKTTEEKHVMKIGMTVQDTSEQGVLWKNFKKEVEEKSGGKLTVELFFSGSLGNDIEAQNKTQIGVIQGFNTSTSNLGTAVTSWKIFDLPYIFQKPSDNFTLFYQDGKLGGPITQVIEKEANGKNLHMLWITPIFFRALAARDTIVKTPNDLKGMKIRTSASEVERAIVQALGGNPITIGPPEMYTAIQNKTVDGVGMPLAPIVSFKLGEVAKKISLIDFQGFAGVASLNAKFYNDLPENLKKVIDDASALVIKDAESLWTKAEKDAKKTLEASGCTIYAPSEAEMNAFKETAKVVYEKQMGLDTNFLKTVQDKIKK